jgi:hypothetical protein
MAMTRKDFRRWTEDPTLKGKRERERRRRKPIYTVHTDGKTAFSR